MAITYGTSGVSAEGGSSPLTWAFNTGTLTNGLLIVAIHAVFSVTSNCTGVTHNGVAMTKATSIYNSANNGEVSIWMLKNPASGSKNIVATAPNATVIAGFAASYSGCLQVSTPDAVNSKQGTTAGDAQSFYILTVADNCWSFASGLIAAYPTLPTIAAIQTTRQNITTNIGYILNRCEDTNGPKTPAGNQSMGFTLSTGAIMWLMAGVSFAPAAPISIPVLEAQYRRRRS